MCDVRDVIFGVRGYYFEIDIIIEINNIGPILDDKERKSFLYTSYRPHFLT